MIATARVYDPVDPDQPPRVLVDRLWPRGIRKEDPRVGRWMPAVAPSSGLRTWFHQHPDRYDEFAERYRAELSTNDALDQLRALLPLTMVTTARDPARSHVSVLVATLA
jgi:uncharacterized protein YeaO (DUF488 family)